MFYLLRQIEHWLQQHIFKVGWLLTRDFKITTILYYTFFMPGILLYELTYWLAAGILDVYAEQSFAWPEKQEIGELRLNFVQLARRTPAWKKFIIEATPLVAGITVIGVVTTQMFGVYDILDSWGADSTSTQLENLGSAITQLTSTADFWFWVWVIFSVSNTMLPDPSALSGWRWVVVGLVLASIPLFFLGIGEQIIGDALLGPVATAINILSVVFGTMIVLDTVILAMLGAIESLIERITGHSATFRNGKMIVMTREEAIAQRKQDMRRGRRPRQQKAPTLPQGPPSVYKLAFSIPGTPGDEPVTRSAATILDTGDSDESERLARPRREEPDVVSGQAEIRINRPIGARPETDDVDDEEGELEDVEDTDDEVEDIEADDEDEEELYDEVEDSV